MIYTDQLKSMRKDCITSIELKLEGAKNGHGHTVLNRTVGCFDLLEITSELLNFREKYGEFSGIEKKKEENKNDRI